jgi:hypothetical protein
MVLASPLSHKYSGWGETAVDAASSLRGASRSRVAMGSFAEAPRAAGQCGELILLPARRRVIPIGFLGIASLVLSIWASAFIWVINGLSTYRGPPVPSGTWIGIGLLFGGISQCALFMTVARIADVLLAAFGAKSPPDDARGIGWPPARLRATPIGRLPFSRAHMNVLDAVNP